MEEEEEEEEAEEVRRAKERRQHKSNENPILLQIVQDTLSLTPSEWGLVGRASRRSDLRKAAAVAVSMRMCRVLGNMDTFESW